MFVIIPAKPFRESKTRLAAALSLEARVHLSRRLLRRTIELARQVGQVVVISRSAEVRRQAKAAGAWALVETGHCLNAAVRQAVQWVSSRSQEILILPADLPYLTAADLTELVDLGWPGPAMVIAPCHRSDGTNALLLSPPSLIDIQFGADSFAHHQATAAAAGLEPIIYRSPTVAFDLDLPEDLAAWQAGRLPLTGITTGVGPNQRFSNGNENVGREGLFTEESVEDNV